MFISVDETAKKWDVTPRQVQRLLSAGRISGAKKFGRSWQIPVDAAKPGDTRQEKKTTCLTLSADLVELFAATTAPFPAHDPDSVLKSADARQRLQREIGLCYLRGDFERVKACYRELGDDDAARLCASASAILAAICTGDFEFFAELEEYLKRVAKSGSGPYVAVSAELTLSIAYVSALAPGMAANWLKEGDFSALHPLARPFAINIRAKYFQGLGQFDPMLTLAQTALALTEPSQGVSSNDIYLRTECAIACCALGRISDAKKHLQNALRVALPHGFITPFAESLVNFGGLLEQVLEREFPEYLAVVAEHWQRTYKCWISFHNRFAQANITSLLSLREYEIAQLAARGMADSEIADRFHISAGRLRIIMHEIYGKLFINSRKQLAQVVI